MSAAEIPDLSQIPEFKLPPPQIESSNVEFGSMLHGITRPRYVEKQDEDFRTIERAKNEYPNHSSKVIFYHILEEKVPLYKFKKSYSVHDLFTWFTIEELKELKTTYEKRKKGIQEEDAAFMDELITLKEKYLREQREQNERVKNLQKNFNEGQGPSCVTMGGRIKNIFRNKNKSNKSKSKRINKRVKKNKRYSRKYSRK